MKNYKIQINKNKDKGINCNIPFVCVNDNEDYSLIYKTNEGKYSAIDLKTGLQLNIEHPRLNGLFENCPKSIGKPIEAEILI